MKIKRINLWHQPLSSHTDYHMAAGKSCTTVETVIVRIDSDTGLSGWGEVCPIPHYLPAYARGVAPAIAEMAPELIGAEFSAPEALLARLDSWLIGHAYAKSALDIALWDLLGRALAQPLHRLLGGKRNQRLPIYHSVTCIAPKAMLAIAEQAYAEGIRQIQVKLGADGDWRNDVERLTTIREALPADALVYGDWNAGATMLDATRVARAVQGLDIMLEQPCETIEAVRPSTPSQWPGDEARRKHPRLRLLNASRTTRLHGRRRRQNLQIRRPQPRPPRARFVLRARSKNVHRRHLG